MLDGDVDVILQVPADFERDLVRDRHAAVQLLLNAEDGAHGGRDQAYAAGDPLAVRGGAGRGSHAGRRAWESVPSAAGARSPQVEIRSRGWYNAELDYRLLHGAGDPRAADHHRRDAAHRDEHRAREGGGTLDQLNVTPITRGVFIAAKLIPLWTIALVVLGIGLTMAASCSACRWRADPAGLRAAGCTWWRRWASGSGCRHVTETQQQAMFVTSRSSWSTAHERAVHAGVVHATLGAVGGRVESDDALHR
jgi:ABC-2 type transport system permease protein